VAEACNRWLRTFRIKPTGVCYNGLDLEFKEASIPDIREMHGANGRRVILAVGRLVREKGIGELVKCFAASTELQAAYILIVIGSGELGDEIAQAARTHSSIIFLGRQPPEVVLGYMKQADVFLNPSNYPEGLPTIILEAGRYGLTVITTPNGGALEVVEHKKTGIVIESGTAAAIERALLELKQDPTIGKEMGLELQKVIFRKFSFKEIVKKLVIEDLGVRPA
jgi:glycosyltransferase involved in cell wall biosynthesis